MKKTDVYPSKYIRSEDIGDNEVKVVIDRIEIEALKDDGSEEKPIMYFKNKTKGMVVNPTNWDRLAYLFGDESDDWPGNAIILYTELVNYQGKVTKGLRVKQVPKTQSAKASPKAKYNPRQEHPRQESENPADVMEDIGGVIGDDIPF